MAVPVRKPVLSSPPLKPPGLGLPCEAMKLVRSVSMRCNASLRARATRAFLGPARLATASAQPLRSEPLIPILPNLAHNSVAPTLELAFGFRPGSQMRRGSRCPQRDNRYQSGVMIGSSPDGAGAGTILPFSRFAFPTNRWTMVTTTQQSIEDQIAELRSQIEELSQAFRDRVSSAADDASERARNAVQTVREQGQGAIEAARNNPGTATAIVSTAGLLGFCLGLYLGLSAASDLRAR